MLAEEDWRCMVVADEPAVVSFLRRLALREVWREEVATLWQSRLHYSTLRQWDSDADLLETSMTCCEAEM
jgi:hypothetical protein